MSLHGALLLESLLTNTTIEGSLSFVHTAMFLQGRLISRSKVTQRASIRRAFLMLQHMSLDITPEKSGIFTLLTVVFRSDRFIVEVDIVALFTVVPEDV